MPLDKEKNAASSKIKESMEKISTALKTYSQTEAELEQPARKQLIASLMKKEDDSVKPAIDSKAARLEKLSDLIRNSSHTIEAIKSLAQSEAEIHSAVGQGKDEQTNYLKVFNTILNGILENKIFEQSKDIVEKYFASLMKEHHENAIVTAYLGQLSETIIDSRLSLSDREKEFKELLQLNQFTLKFNEEMKQLIQDNQSLFKTLENFGADKILALTNNNNSSSMATGSEIVMNFMSSNINWLRQLLKVSKAIAAKLKSFYEELGQSSFGFGQEVLVYRMMYRQFVEMIEQYEVILQEDVNSEIQEHFEFIYLLCGELDSSKQFFARLDNKKKVAMLEFFMDYFSINDKIVKTPNINEMISNFSAFLDLFTEEAVLANDFSTPEQIKKYLEKTKVDLYSKVSTLDGPLVDLANTKTGRLVNVSSNMPRDVIESMLTKSQGIAFLQDHLCGESIQQLIDGLLVFKSFGVKKIFIELDEQYKDLFAEFHKSGDLQMLGQNMIKLFNGIIEGQANNNSTEMLPKTQAFTKEKPGHLFYFHILRLAKAAQNVGIQLCPFDDRSRINKTFTFFGSKDSTEKTLDELLDYSDPRMAKNIKSMLNDSEKYLVLVGSQHINIANKNNLNIPTYLYLSSYFVDDVPFQVASNEKSKVEVANHLTKVGNYAYQEMMPKIDVIAVVPYYQHEKALYDKEFSNLATELKSPTV